MLTMITIIALAITLHIIFWKQISEGIDDEFIHCFFSVFIYAGVIAVSFIFADKMTDRMVTVETKEYPLVKTDNRYFTKTVDRFGNPYFTYTWLFNDQVNVNSTRSFMQSDKAVAVVKITRGKDSIWVFDFGTRINVVEVRGPLEDITGEKVVEKQ